MTPEEILSGIRLELGAVESISPELSESLWKMIKDYGQSEREKAIRECAEIVSLYSAEAQCALCGVDEDHNKCLRKRALRIMDKIEALLPRPAEGEKA